MKVTKHYSLSLEVLIKSIFKGNWFSRYREQRGRIEGFDHSSLVNSYADGIKDKGDDFG